MTSIRDVVRKGRCVDAERVPCKKAQDYLKKKGLLCKTDSPPPKPIPSKRKTKSLFRDWFG